MWIQKPFFFFSFIFSAIAFSNLNAQESSSPGKKEDSKMIIIEEGSRHSLEKNRNRSKASVESGESEIVGDDLATMAAAKRSWQQECTEWKNEVRSLNKNNLLIADCGKPQLKDSMHQSEKTYRYESVAKYKIRVVAAED